MAFRSAGCGCAVAALFFGVVSWPFSVAAATAGEGFFAAPQVWWTVSGALLLMMGLVLWWGVSASRLNRRLIAAAAAREQAETALGESEDRFRNAFEAGGVGMYLLDGDGVFINVNESLANFFGYSPGELRGTEILPHLHPDELEEGRRNVRDLASGKRPNIIFERRYLHRDGTVLTGLVSASTVSGRDGALRYIIANVQDITDRKAAERALTESEQRHRSIMDNVADSVVTIDVEGRIETVNPAACAMFGYQAEELVGRKVNMLMPAPFSAAHDGYISAYLETGRGNILGIGPREVQGLRKDGSVFPMSLTVGEMYLGDKRIFIGVARDITEVKNAAEQLRHAHKLEAIGQLTGGLAHDFNNLLTIILGNLQLLLRRTDDDKMRDMVITAEKAGRRGADLTQRLLAFGRRQPLEPAVVDLNLLVQGMTDLLRRTLGENIEIETATSGGLRMTLADPAQIENAILNLAINARDAMPQGGRLTIQTGNRTIDAAAAAGGDDVLPGAYVMLAVGDTGAGMAPEIVERAFDPFFTTKEAGLGSGLGLSMIYGFCQQSGGFAAIHSEPGAGTTVSLYLPVTDAIEETAVETAPEMAENRGNETVLVVEDDPGVRLFATTVLNNLSYNVLEAGDGTAALEAMDSNGRIDVLFTDIVLPGGVDGRDIADQARKRQPEIGVLLTSGFATDDGDASQDFDAHAILRKPYTGADLLAKIRSVLDGHQERRE